jgi:hypothetical protein
MFRSILALPFLLLAMYALKAAYWVCPGLRDTDKPSVAVWLDAPEGWDKRVN